MKVGILVCRQYPFISANTAIAYEIGEELNRRYGHEIIFIGYKQDNDQNEVRDYKGFPIYFFNKKIYSATRLKYANYIKRIIGLNYEAIAGAKGLKRILSDNKLDALICFCAPSITAAIVEAAKLDMPCIMFQLDPYYNVGDTENSKLKEEFIRITGRFKEVFTTDLLYKIYIEDKRLAEVALEKFSVAQFPKINKARYNTAVSGNRKTARFLYAGTLYQSIRPPEVLITLRKCLPPEYELVYCGKLESSELEKTFEEAGIKCMGYCSQERLQKELQEADILVNIGNRVRNQLGSKLIEYISTGKPILNVMLIDDCPTEPVLMNYKLHLSVYFTDMKNSVQKIQTQIHEFAENSLGKQEPWDTIKKYYEPYTIEYVAKQVQDALIRTGGAKDDAD